jgi:hypothetical protein
MSVRPERLRLPRLKSVTVVRQATMPRKGEVNPRSRPPPIHQDSGDPRGTPAPRENYLPQMLRIRLSAIAV